MPRLLTSLAAAALSLSVVVPAVRAEPMPVDSPETRAARVKTPEEAKKLDEQYVPGPDSKAQEGVPKGKLIKREYAESKTYPGTVRQITIYVPAQYDGGTPACVYVSQDGVQYGAPTVFDNLIAKKQMPVTIGIFITPGTYPPKAGEPAKKPDGKPGGKSNRSVEYDTVDDTYAKFIVDEILPMVAKEYKLTDNPDGRCIAGSSSGGICAFNVAWQRTEAFHKVFTTVGSFTNIRGGHVFPELVRKAEKKPIRVYQQDGANDLDNTAGSWPEANKLMAAALKDKGYDHHFEFGQGVHSGRHGTAIFPDAMRWMWRDYPGVVAK